MKLDKIQIRNFRSLENLTLQFSRLNLFVGRNDSGKSNILRALDLFFNYGQGYQFRWERDFCAFAKTPQRKAPEISISITIRPPSSFSNRKPIKWIRVWRKDGLHKDSLTYSDNSAIHGKSKVGALLKNARLDYVPAIRGEDYFSELLASIHDMLERTVEEEIRGAAGNFTESINAHTTKIVSDILKKLSLNSSIQLPSDLRDLFSRLEFSSETNGHRFYLDQRGDGIKARHIPIILNWLANQAETLSAPGRPKVVSMWAYEEPENSLELSSCIDLAKEILQQCGKIQTFISTHSPAIYSIALDSPNTEVSVFGVVKDQTTHRTTIEPISSDSISTLDTSMGLMPLVQPYISSALDRIKTLKKAQKELTDPDKPTVFVEGPSDRELIKDAISIYYSDISDSLTISCSESSGGGHAWVSDRVIAWGHLRTTKKGIGLFDKDQEAVQSRKDAIEVLKRKKSHNAKCLHLMPNANMKSILREGFPIPFSIDELFRKKDWKYAEEKGWLEPRSNRIKLYRYDNEELSFLEYLDQKFECEGLKRFVTHKIKRANKLDFCNYLKDLPIEDKEDAFKFLKPTLQSILNELQLLS